MNKPKEEQGSAQAQFTPETVSQRIIQNWFAGIPGGELQELADAAPELLAACQAAVELLSHLPSRVGGIGTTLTSARLETAIARATGDQS